MVSVENLRREFVTEDEMYGYVEGAMNAFVAAQIKELREEREMSQQDLADAIGTKQSGISRLENANYSSWKVETLRKIARAYGVRLRISFEEFGTLVSELEQLNRRLRPRKHAEDPVLHPELAKANTERESNNYTSALKVSGEDLTEPSTTKTAWTSPQRLRPVRETSPHRTGDLIEIGKQHG